MKRILTLLTLATALGVLLLGCGPEQTPRPPGSGTPTLQGVATASPTPCATLPALSASGTVSVPAGVRSTPPASVQQTPPSPQQLATLEAIVAQRNRGAPTIPAGQVGAPILPWCATPTPAK